MTAYIIFIRRNYPLSTPDFRQQRFEEVVLMKRFFKRYYYFIILGLAFFFVRQTDAESIETFVKFLIHMLDSPSDFAKLAFFVSSGILVGFNYNYHVDKEKKAKDKGENGGETYDPA